MRSIVCRRFNTTVSQMDKAASAEETASASAELSAQSGELKNAFNELLKLISGTSTTSSLQKGTVSPPAARLPSRPPPKKIPLLATQLNPSSQEEKNF